VDIQIWCIVQLHGTVYSRLSVIMVAIILTLLNVFHGRVQATKDEPRESVADVLVNRGLNEKVADYFAITYLEQEDRLKAARYFLSIQSILLTRVCHVRQTMNE
jgi:hypothetical protein